MTTATKALQVTPRGDREIVMTRVFDAPRTLVWDAFTKPEYLKRWLYGPDDWTLPVCEYGQRAGEKYRYAWHGPKGAEMAAGGVIREMVPPERLVVTERFEEPWYSGEAIITFVFSEASNRTTLTQTLSYESREARDLVLKSGMEVGLSMSFDRLEKVFASV
jgi:uncharacterized protein YndB with AHSA1/START domain